MSSFGPPIPPDPTNDNFAGAPDQISSATYTVESDLKDAWNWTASETDKLGATLGAMWDSSHILERIIAVVEKTAAFLVLELAKTEGAILSDWVGLEAQIYAGAAAPLEAAAADEANIAMGILLQAMSGAAGGDHNFGSSGMAGIAQQLFNALVQPFTLVSSGLDPSQTGSGLSAQQFLLEKASGMALQEWVVEQLGNHLGMGFFKTLAPFLGIVDRSINPANVVRQAMDSSFTFMLKAPLTRDLNRLYPIKDIGVTALAHEYIRGVIDEPTYLDRCLDSGLNSERAQQLIVESARLLAEGDIAKLLNLGYLQQSDAGKLLAQLGYTPASVQARLYLDTHERYFTLQERVGGEAVTAFKHGYITQTRLETLLQHLGYTADEISLLEIEAEFVKGKDTTVPTLKSLTYSQVTAMYKANIVGIDDVITFLQNEGYSSTDVINLVLLDFTVAAERAAQRNVLMARLRVIAQAELVSAQTAAGKNETALATAKQQLASELEAEANTLGTIYPLGGILTTLNVIP